MLPGTIASWLRQTITIAPYSSMNDYGEATYGTAVSVACRLVQENKMVRDRGGRETVSTVNITIDGSIDVDVRDLITLPDTTTPPILSIEDIPGPDGVSYIKVIYT